MVTIRQQARKNYVIQVYVNPDHKEALDSDLELIREKYSLDSKSATIRFCLKAGIEHLK